MIAQANKKPDHPAIGEAMKEEVTKMEERSYGAATIPPTMTEVESFDLAQSYDAIRRVLSKPLVLAIWIIGRDWYQAGQLYDWLLCQVSVVNHWCYGLPDPAHYVMPTLFGCPVREWVLDGTPLPVPAEPGVWIEIANAPALLLARYNEAAGLVEEAPACE